MLSFLRYALPVLHSPAMRDEGWMPYAPCAFHKEVNMRLPKFEYLEPRSLKEAAKALAADPGGTLLLAGGTDLIVNM